MLLADPPKPVYRGTCHAWRIGPTFRCLLPCGDLLQLNEIPAEVVFLPLLVTQALQKGCRGRTCRKESQCSRVKSRPHLGRLLLLISPRVQPRPTSHAFHHPQGQRHGRCHILSCCLCSGRETEDQGEGGVCSAIADPSSEFDLATF